MKSLFMVLALFLFATPATAKTKELTLSADNTLVLTTDFNGSSVSKLMEQAKKLDSNLKAGYPMYLFMYTPGGSIQAGLELIEYLNGLNRPVHTITMFSASMGWQAVQHLGTRYIVNYGVLMSHRARGSFGGEFGGGFAQLDSRYGLWLRRINMMDEKTVNRTEGKQTLESYRNAYASELWLNGPEAVEQGYADEVVGIKCDPTLTGTFESVANFGFFKVKAAFSKCPINTSPRAVKGYLYTNKGEMSVSDFLAKNGKFGKLCSETGTKDSTNWKGIITPGKEPELCSKDKSLTLEKILKTIEEKKAFYNRDLKNSIVYSY